MQRDAIIATLPPAFFKEYTLERFEQEMEQLNHDDEMAWFMILKNLPKVQTPYFYFLYDGKIRYRAEISQFIRGATMRFTRADGGLKTFANKNFVQHDIPMRGFQGFRYTELLF